MGSSDFCYRVAIVLCTVLSKVVQGCGLSFYNGSEVRGQGSRIARRRGGRSVRAA